MGNWEASDQFICYFLNEKESTKVSVQQIDCEWTLSVTVFRAQGNCPRSWTENNAELSTVLTAFHCFCFVTLVRTDNSTDTSPFEIVLTLLCLSATSHSPYQSNCVLTRVYRECFAKSITLAQWWILHPPLIKPIHEILLNVRENLYHYNGILIMCHYDVMSCTKVAVTAEAVQSYPVNQSSSLSRCKAL